MRRQSRVAVPLNAMCSRKWLTPLLAALSLREPVATKAPRLTLSRWGMWMLSTRTALGRTETRTVMPPLYDGAPPRRRHRGIGDSRGACQRRCRAGLAVLEQAALLHAQQPGARRRAVHDGERLGRLGDGG